MNWDGNGVGCVVGFLALFGVALVWRYWSVWKNVGGTVSLLAFLLFNVAVVAAALYYLNR